MSASARDRKTGIAPMLSVRRGSKAIEFYKAAFGAGELFRIDSENGEVVARLSVGAAEFWVADESPEHKFQPRVPRRRHCAYGHDRGRSGCRFRSRRRRGRHRGLAPQQPIRLAPGTNRRPVRTPLGNRQAVVRRLLSQIGNNRLRAQRLARPTQREPRLGPLLRRRLEISFGQLRLGFHGLAPAVARLFLLAQRFPHVPEVEQRFCELRLL
jgi:hypothetical protein